MIAYASCRTGCLTAFAAFVARTIANQFATFAENAFRFAVILVTAAGASDHRRFIASFAFQWCTNLPLVDRFAIAIAFVIEAIQAVKPFLIRFVTT